MKIVRNKSGYTLLELVIVLGILAILTGVFTTDFIQFKARTRVKTAIRQIIVLQKAVNNMATICQGYPVRDKSKAISADLPSILPIIDLTSCDKNAVVQDPSKAPLIYPSQVPCQGEALGTEIHTTTLCKSSCLSTDKACQSSMGENFYHAFITVAGQTCSPQYGGQAGTYPGNYQPGWNYALLYDNMVTSAVDKPVGVICGMALGYKETVKIVVNTSGHFGGNDVPEGAGCYDINGTILANPCPCGPWCQVYSSGGVATARNGCCGPCKGNSGIAACGAPCPDPAHGCYTGIGYNF